MNACVVPFSALCGRECCKTDSLYICKLGMKALAYVLVTIFGDLNNDGKIQQIHRLICESF
jgi:hypothetical protein